MIRAYNIFSRSEHVGKQGLLREANSTVLSFLAEVVSSIVITEGMTDKVLK